MSGVPQRLEAVVVPTVARELDELIAMFHRWEEPSTAPHATPVPQALDLLVLYNRVPPADAEDRIRSTIAGLERVRDAFRTVTVDHADLTEAEDVYSGAYLTENWDELSFGRGGYKSGPNSQFFYMTERCREWDTVLQMEVDCHPLRAGWLGQAIDTVDRHPHRFWIMGSIYRGRSDLDDSIRHHMNGNAFYATGDDDFNHFLREEFRPYLDHVVAHVDPRLAYDTMFEFFLRDVEQWPRVQQIRHKFVYTPFVLNYGGDPLHTGGDRDHISSVRDDNPEAYLVHGKLLTFDE